MIARALSRVLLAVSLAAAVVAQQRGGEGAHGLGAGAPWRGPARPTAKNDVFATADGCAMCHSNSAASTAMRTATGEAASPHALWRGSVMANSFRDPYWRAQVAKEIAEAPERALEVQSLCLRCHAPMVHHSRRIGGQEPVAVAAVATDPLARDGVSCAVCHQIGAQDLGTDATFDGQGAIARGRRVFGPFADPVAAPMVEMTGFMPTHGAHVQSSALCATCHTLRTAHAGPTFPEQTPYFEWRNSEFTDEGEAGATATSRTCQQCHMADLGGTRIVRHPGGGDFLVPRRGPYRSHAIVGGNAFLLDLLAANRDELGVTAPVEALRQNAVATRRQLAEDTVALAIEPPVRGQGRLRFAVRVENLTGHKFPTGYPSRRAWLHVQVRAGRDVVFDSGGWTTDGHLADVADPLRQPHHTLVTEPSQVVVWELIALDANGEPTTHLTRMATRGKDTRLLPKGWRRDGPHAEETAPVGTGSDLDFTAGGDTVHFDVPLDANAPAARVVAWVRYQTIPAHWVDALRGIEADESRTFVRLYDAADKTPETAAVALRDEER